MAAQSPSPVGSLRKLGCKRARSVDQVRPLVGNIYLPMRILHRVERFGFTFLYLVVVSSSGQNVPSCMGFLRVPGGPKGRTLCHRRRGSKLALRRPHSVGTCPARLLGESFRVPAGR
jgi:hypothetical protein